MNPLGRMDVSEIRLIVRNVSTSHQPIIEKESVVGNKGGKKDKDKSQKQKMAKTEQKAQKMQDKQPKKKP